MKIHIESQGKFFFFRILFLGWFSVNLYIFANILFWLNPFLPGSFYLTIFLFFYALLKLKISLGKHLTINKHLNGERYTIMLHKRIQ